MGRGQQAFLNVLVTLSCATITCAWRNSLGACLDERQKRSQAALTALLGGSKGAKTTRTSRRDHGPVRRALVREAP